MKQQKKKVRKKVILSDAKLAHKIIKKYGKQSIFLYKTNALSFATKSLIAIDHSSISYDEAEAAYNEIEQGDCTQRLNTIIESLHILQNINKDKDKKTNIYLRLKHTKSSTAAFLSMFRKEIFGYSLYVSRTGHGPQTMSYRELIGKLLGVLTRLRALDIRTKQRNRGNSEAANDILTTKHGFTTTPQKAAILRKKREKVKNPHKLVDKMRRRMKLKIGGAVIYAIKTFKPKRLLDINWEPFSLKWGNLALVDPTLLE
jgi:hypothetical protein